MFGSCFLVGYGRPKSKLGSRFEGCIILYSLASNLKRRTYMNIKDWLLKEEKEEVFLVSDISKHGCSGGVCGIIYYNETVRFHDEHEKEIWDLLYEYAENEGLKLIDKIAQVCKDTGSLTQLKNQLVWWAVEVRAHEICSEREAA